MNKKQFKDILEQYIKAEQEVYSLDYDHGIIIYDTDVNNFYHAFRNIIFTLFEAVFGQDGRGQIEYYLFQENDMSFDELCKKLNLKD